MNVDFKTILIEASSCASYDKLRASAKATKRFVVQAIKRGVGFSVTGAAPRIDAWLQSQTERNARWFSSTNAPRALFKPRALHASAAVQLKPATAASSPVFTCTEYASMYSFPSPPTPSPSGLAVISVVSFGGGLFGTASPVQSDGLIYITAGDVQAHWRGLGILAGSMPRVAIKLLPGATNAPGRDLESTGENTLDVEMIGACYPSASLLIVLFIAPNTFSAFVDVLSMASSPIKVAGVTQPVLPSAVSVSWGAPETAFGSAVAGRINAVMQTAAKAGVNICVATGDNGASDGTRALCCDFPSSSPYAIACGGTSLVCPSRTRSDPQLSETVWTGTGGGASRVFAKPPHQYAVAGSSRQTPDVALNADPNTGVWFTINGAVVQLGGTSIVAPAFAAWIALTRTRAFLPPMLYTSSFRTAYYDIVSGSNEGYWAGTGYDNCSGLGSINGTTLATLIASNVAVTGISAAVTAAFITSTSSITFALTATVTPAGASSKALTWSISNSAVARISATPTASTATIVMAAAATLSTSFTVAAADSLTATVTGSVGFTKTSSKLTLVLSAVTGKDLKPLLPALAGISTYLALASSSPGSIAVTGAAPTFNLAVVQGTRRGTVVTITAVGVSVAGAVRVASVALTLL